MRLGETLTIKIGAENVVLRPTLRHAFLLERREGGIVRLGMALDEHSLDAACTIIREHTGMLYLENRVHDAGVEKLAPLLSNYLLTLMGLDLFDGSYDEHNANRTKVKYKPFIETLTWLFEVATGWLGWSPEEAWKASPMEIMAAYKGRMAMLRAVLGGEERAEERPAPEDLDDKIKAIFGRIGTVKAAA